MDLWLMNSEDQADLGAAYELLERRSLTARLVEAVGQPVELGLRVLPRRMTGLVHAASRRAIERALSLALETMGREPGGAAANRLHKLLAGMSGALGGFFGLAALAAELPLSTMIMLRSVAAVARSQGEDLRSPEARLACVEVFALGRPATAAGGRALAVGPTPGEEAAETGYYAVRMALARELTEAVRFVAQRPVAEEGAPILVRLIARIAARFSVTVSEKVAAQAIPVVGALGGLAVNLIFIQHFQDLAQGHFTIRRLERAYGPDTVRAAYERLREPAARVQAA